MMNCQNSAGTMTNGSCMGSNNGMGSSCMDNNSNMGNGSCMDNNNGMGNSSCMNNNNGMGNNSGMMNHARMNGNQMNQKELGEWVSMLGFCAIDMLLYMDTHPDDQNALDYFNQCTELYNAAKKTYEERCGQLNAFSGGPLSSWDWNTAPMPWEGGR